MSICIWFFFLSQPSVRSVYFFFHLVSGFVASSPLHCDVTIPPCHMCMTVWRGSQWRTWVGDLECSASLDALDHFLPILVHYFLGHGSRYFISGRSHIVWSFDISMILECPCTQIHVYMLFLDRPHVCVSIRSWYVRTCAALLYRVLVIRVWPVIFHSIWRRYVGITWIVTWQWA